MISFNVRRIVMGLLCICIVQLSGCKRESRWMNESLRLTPTEIEECKAKAVTGDKEAAKRLWHHYAGVELNMVEGEKWRHVYEQSKDAGSPAQHPQDQ